MTWLIAIWLIAAPPADTAPTVVPATYLDGGWATREECVEALDSLWLSDSAGAAAMACVEAP